MRYPARARLATEQFELGAGAQRLDQLIKFHRLPRVPPFGHGCVQDRRLARECDRRPPADSQDAMLSLATEPVAAPECGLTQVRMVRSSNPRVDDLDRPPENWR